MSRLDDLIKELCPDGVKHIPLGCFAKVENGRNRDRQCVNAYSITQRGLIPTSDYFGETKITSDDTSNYKIVKQGWFVYSPSRIDVGSINYLKGEREVIVSPLNVVFSVDESVIRQDYLLYFLSTRNGTWQILTKREGIEGTGRKLLPFERFATIIVPVPPMQIQDKICSMLDCFARYIDSIHDELEVRKKQYEYYANDLFPSCNNSLIDWIELGSVATVTKLAGFEFTKYVTYSDAGEIIALRGLNIKNGHLVLNDIKFIDNSNLAMLTRSKLNVGDMLFTYVGTIGQVALVDENDRYYLAPNVALVRINEDIFLSKFVMYYFMTRKFKHEQIEKLLQSSSMQNIPMEKIRKFKLPNISLKEQQHIISILDRFDALCNDITSGLPAEIAARQKHYEYYRDKLLTFKEYRPNA